jgi:hypothetical protein
MVESKTYQLIEDINNLTVAKWEACICEQNFSVLVVKGNPDDITLIECWSNLYAQYLDILGDAEIMYVLQLESEIEQLNFKIITTEGILLTLDFFHVSDLVETLKLFGFDTRYLIQGNPQYNHSLLKIKGRLAHLKLKLELKRKERDQITLEDAQEIVTRDRLQRQRARLSKFQGYPIKPTKTFVPDYIAILKEYLSQFKLKEDGNEQKGQNH